MTGIVKDILFSGDKQGELRSYPVAEAQAGKGIVGDRYYSAQGTFSSQLKDLPEFEMTLIEQEEIDSFNKITKLNYCAAKFRRNIVTQGIRLNDLVDKEFTIGNVKLKGIRLCEPCHHLSTMIGPEVLEHMVNKAGLRAQILVSGKIYISDTIMQP